MSLSGGHEPGEGLNAAMFFLCPDKHLEITAEPQRPGGDWVPAFLRDEGVGNQAAKQNTLDTKIRYKYIVYAWYHVPGTSIFE